MYVVFFVFYIVFSHFHSHSHSCMILYVAQFFHHNFSPEQMDAQLMCLEEIYWWQDWLIAPYERALKMNTKIEEEKYFGWKRQINRQWHSVLAVVVGVDLWVPRASSAQNVWEFCLSSALHLVLVVLLVLLVVDSFFFLLTNFLLLAKLFFWANVFLLANLLANVFLVNVLLANFLLNFFAEHWWLAYTFGSDSDRLSDRFFVSVVYSPGWFIEGEIVGW